MIFSSMTTNTKLNIVVDTNQFLSGFLYHGMMKIVFDLLADDKLLFYVSSTLQKEVLAKLRHFAVNQQEQSNIMAFIKTKGIFIEPTIHITACRDPKDNYLLELAETADADYLITRDKDLLDLPKSRYFLPLLRTKKLIG